MVGSCTDLTKSMCCHYRSVSSWFDEDGVLLYDLLEKDIYELHHDLAAEKKDK